MPADALQCKECKTTYGLEARYVCEKCFGPLEARYDLTGIDPAETRGMWQEAIGHVVGCWTNDQYEFAGEHWSMPRRRVASPRSGAL
mgnify:CR=1 FL=1